MLFGIEMPRGEIPELPEARDVRIKRAFEAAHRHLEGIAGVEHERVGRRDQRVPIGRLDIDADLPSRIGAGVAERDDLLFQPHLQPAERHRRRLREFKLEVAQSAAENRTVPQLLDQRADAVRRPGQRAVDAFMRQQHAAFQLKVSADRPQRPAQFAEIRQGCELIEGGDFMGHRADLAGGRRRGKPVNHPRF